MIAQLTILLALLFSAISAQAQWDFDNAEPLTFAAGAPENHLAVDNAGTLHAVFRQGLILNYYWRETDAETWHGPEVVNDSLSMTNPGEFALACNPESGAAHVVYTSNNHVWYAWRNGTNSWMRNMINDPNEPAVTPDIAVNENGQLYVVYVIEVADVYQLEYAYYDGAEEWWYDIIPGDLGAFGSGASPRVGIDANGVGHAIFRAVGASGYKVQHATNNEAGGTGWDLTDLEVPHPESYPGDIAVEPNGKVHCATQGSEGFGMPRPVYYHSRTPQGVWSFGLVITDMLAAGNPVVAYDTQHGGHAMWLPLSGNFYTGEIFYSGATTNWAPEYINDNISSAPAFVIDGDNYGHMLMETGGGEVLYLKSDEPLAGGVFEPELTITPDTINFGNISPGEDTTVQITLENTGTATLTLNDLEVVGFGFSGPPQWIVVNLEPGAFMTTEVTFAPTIVLPYSGAAIIHSNAESTPDSILLRGQSGSPWGPEISIEPDTLNFDTVIVGENSTQSVRLENPNEDILRITGFTLESDVFHGPAQWSTIELWWGQHMDVAIQFAPLANSVYVDRVIVVSNALTSPDTVYLVGRGAISDAAPELPLPSEFALHPLYPNPFNGAVNVSFTLPKASDVNLSVYDVLGREVGKLLSERMNAGEHQLQWNCAECAAGVYLFKLSAAGSILAQKAVYAK